MFKSLTLTKNLSLISSFLHDSDRKSFPKLMMDFARLVIRQRCIPKHYISRYMYKKDCENIFDFLPDKFLYELKSKFNDREVIEVLENKLYFDLFYRQFGVSLPKILMFNHKKLFVIADRWIEVNNLDEFRLLLKEIFRDKDSGFTVFVKPTYGTYGGDGIYKIAFGQLSDNSDLINKIYLKVLKSGYLFQETICQHPHLDKLNPSCINTIRIVTFIDRSGKIEIISAFLRMSISNYYLDNTEAGGCAVSINLNTGCLAKYGYKPFSKSGGKRLIEHPLTNTVFDAFTIPDFYKVKELVIKAASFMPGLRLIGWDVGLGINGPVLIEGNSDYNIHGSDKMYGGLRANPVFRKALEEIGYYFTNPLE